MIPYGDFSMRANNLYEGPHDNYYILYTLIQVPTFLLDSILYILLIYTSLLPS